MPRATRAAARAQELAEEAATAASIALPPTPNKDRVPLGDISSNANASVKMNIVSATDAEDAQQKPAPESKKAKGGKKAKKGGKSKPKEQEVEVLEDDYQSSQSEAAEQACNNLLDSHGKISPRNTYIQLTS